MGTVNVEAQHSLEAVTATGNITPLTIEFTNPTTSLVASGNVEVAGNVVAGYLYGDGSNISGISSNLDQIVNIGNVTSNTVQFSNAITSLTAASNIVVTGNVTAGSFLGDGSALTALNAANIGSGTLPASRGGTGTTSSTGTGSVVLSATPAFTGDATFNTNTLKIDATNNRVGIGTTNPIASLDIDGGPESDIVPALSIRGGIYDTSDLYVLNTYSVSTGVGYAAKVIGVNIKNKVETDNTVQLRNNVGGLTSAGAIYLGSDNTTNQGVFGVLTCEGVAGTALTEKFTVTDSGNVGIGTTTPYTPFEIYTNVGGNSGGGMRIHHVTGSPRLDFVRGGSYRSPNTSVFGASNYADWSIGTGGANFRITKQVTTENSGNEATVMQIQHNGPILSQLSTGWTGNNPNSGDGDNYTASSLYRDYSSWVSIFKSGWVDTASGWGTFWAGNSGAAYRRESGDNNPNEYVFVGDGNKRFTFELNNGQAYFDAGLTQNNYDYAEYFEWEDGNPDNEDRRGYSVVLGENGKIKKATSDDEPKDIFGIVSGTSSIVGDAACYDWHGKYEVDEWGSRVTDEVYQLTWTTEEGKNHSYDEDRVPEGITVPDDVSRRLHNRERITPGYDDTAVYIPRDKRKEWCPVGLVGKVRLRNGCPTNPNWRYMKTVAGKQLWLIR